MAHDDFNEVAGPPKPDPVSKWELERLENERKTPELNHNLPPPTLGDNENERLQQEQRDREREERINYIRERLDAQRHRASNDFKRAR